MAIRQITLEELKDMPGMTEEELERFNAIKDEDIDFSDAPRLTEEQLKNAKRLRDVHPEWFTVRKKSISLRLDCDVLEAFKSMGKGYQTKINNALREYLKEHNSANVLGQA